MGSHLILRGHALRSEFEHLYTFREMRSWHIATSEVAADMDRTIQHLRSQFEHLEAQADSLARSHACLPLIERLFTARTNERELRHRAALLERTIDDLGTALNSLLECLDYSPKDARECCTLLGELRGERNALLATRDRPSSENLFRHKAPIMTTTGSQRLFVYCRKASTAERRAIRRHRASALAPYEDHAVAFERQLRELDRYIRWVERFATDD